jgi:hypothetical protein
MKRRTFLAGLGSAAAWPLVGRAQQGDRVRRIGVLASGDENDPVGKTRLSAFTQVLADLGWTDGRNMRVALRWGGGDINRIEVLAQELVGLQLDIILSNGTPATVAFQRETRTIPIVFANVDDPVASGIVPRLDRPSGNITGFAILEATLGSKWLELLAACNLSNTQACRIGRRQRNAVAQSRNCFQETRDLLTVENRRKLLGFFAGDNPLERLLLAERDAVEEPQRAGHLIDV